MVVSPRGVRAGRLSQLLYDFFRPVFKPESLRATAAWLQQELSFSILPIGVVSECLIGDALSSAVVFGAACEDGGSNGIR